MTQTVVVLGAAGRVGDAVARAFLDKGWDVRGVARNAKAAQLAAGVEAINADATDRASLIQACEGADVIVNALNPLYTGSELREPLTTAGVEVVVTLTPFYKRLKDIQPQTRVRRLVATSIKEYLPPHLPRH